MARAVTVVSKHATVVFTLVCAHYLTAAIASLQVWRDLALAYASQQQPGDAEKCVQHMRALDPDSAASYHAMGAVAASCRNDVAAKAAYKAALALDAAYAPALLSLGECPCMHTLS